jgi:hypothetical protein
MITEQISWLTTRAREEGNRRLRRCEWEAQAGEIDTETSAVERVLHLAAVACA